MYTSLLNWLEKYLVALVIGGLIAGVAVASFSPVVVDQVNALISRFMDLYGFVAPFAIFMILAPSLSKLFSSRNLGKFGFYVIRWFALRKLLAAVWATVFIAIILRLPFLPRNSVSLIGAVSQTMQSLGKMALTSPYFWAMYAAIIVALIATKLQRLQMFLEKILDGVERAGSYFLPIIPVFMFAIGAYIYGLPKNVADQIGLVAGGANILTDLNIWGWKILPTSTYGMLTIYILGALFTAIACYIWQFVFLLQTKRQEPRFTIRGYFQDYWLKVYPLLWATSSEALATPLNLYLTKKHLPWVRPEIRRLVVGGGSYMGINGTIINVFVLGAIVLTILGLQPSIVELLMIIPIVFLISYGVPGIPGELVLFAGPMATLLNIPEAIAPIFLAIYLGLQIGLSDSFRTGNNSTDNYIGAVLMNAVYERDYADKEGPKLEELMEPETG